MKKSGIVCIAGRPSAGKSTFLNGVCGQKVAIVSDLPQTTRNAVRGIVTTDAGQLVFIDTPGYHTSGKKMNRKLKSITENALHEADAVLYLIDAARSFGEEELSLCTLLKNMQDKVVVGINKVDSAEARPGLTAAELMRELPAIPKDRFFEISALNKEGIQPLTDMLYRLLPESELLYPEEFYTDQPVAFRITEVIREHAIKMLYDEIPHALYVRIEDMTMKKNGKELFVRAFLCVERESQKAMVIGKGASVIKSIRLGAQHSLCKILPYRVTLDLQVRVDKNWRQKDHVLKSIFQE